MAQTTTAIDWDTLLKAAGPYPIEALNFVREGLSYTVKCIHDRADAAGEIDRHVSGQQLCLGLRDYAIEQYGLLARTVLRHWHIHRTSDFGRIVFAMIDAGLMSRTDDDQIDDFRAVFDFDEAFERSELLARLGDGIH